MRVAAALVASAALMLCAAEAGAQVEPGIAYNSAGKLKLVRPDGTGRTAIGRGYNADWSPDGSAIAFVRGNRLIVKELASGMTRTVATGRVTAMVSFSPDGQSIAYGQIARVDGEGVYFLRVAAADGSGSRDLTEPAAGRLDVLPDWSPDGTTVAFTRVRGVRAEEIWTIAADGTSARRLARDAEGPAWSPDGSRIAFSSSRDENGQTCFHDCFANHELYVMDASGAGQTRLTRTQTDERSPDWSPDGEQIAFDSARPVPEGNRELYAMRSDGSCVSRLTNTSVDNAAPAWRPGTAYSAPLVCGGAVSGAMMPAFETNLRAARRHKPFPLAWLGESYRGVMASAFDDAGAFATFIYDDCGRIERPCRFRQIQVQTHSICEREPLRYGGYFGPGEPDMSPHARRYRRARGALVADYGPHVDVHAGRVTIALFGRRSVAVARALARFPGSHSILALPRFPREVLSRVRRVRAALRRYGERELSRRWRMSPEQIEAAVRLRRTLRRAELRGGTRCR